MHLERLEINGFKSFSDRSELAFDRGVTAIVGPNGCGKSNVADAITWVMGEQSAKSLRGERMEDVIFNGSDARKPTATAEVRLRFSGVLMPRAAGHPESHGRHGNGHGNGHTNGHTNGNGHANGNGHEAVALAAVEGGLLVDPAGVMGEPGEDDIAPSVARDVEVIRRLYRSGESEYLIDGQTCRLRDIHDLLMDTGLGAKAYAIIEQGKIGMILSTRPTDRRMLIEEAAGVTKYKTRRRSAELKLEAAQQNLTRIDDIVLEVEKQRGTLKRQAAKARRYQKLRDELRRWEKVLYARKYRQLADTIATARGRLVDARERESAAASQVSEIESHLARVRIELVEGEERATSAREGAHLHELEINRLQQQASFDREQVQTLSARSTLVASDLDALEARREPALAALAAGRVSASAADSDRDRAAGVLQAESGSYESARQEIEGLEADVEAARSEVFSAINSATALHHSLEHASTAANRVAETLSKLRVETDDVRIELERVTTDRAEAAARLRRAQGAIDATRIARAARESELASARIEHEWRARSVRSREQELAGLEARLASLEELEASRAGFGDAARAVLAQANGRVNQRGAVADYLDVTPGFERAVEACLGDLLQHVIVEAEGYAASGLELVRSERAGRCGFLIAAEPSEALSGQSAASVDGLTALSSVVGVNGPFATAIRHAIGEGWIADSYDRASEASRTTAAPVATLVGDVFRGPHLVSGGSPSESRGILENKRDIRELTDQIAIERAALQRLNEETAEFESIIAQSSSAIAALGAELHREEKAAVSDEGHVQRAADEATRLAQKGDQLARELRQAEEERDALERRQEEGREAIARLGESQGEADDRLNTAQRRLLEARESAEAFSRRASEARAAHAALVERAASLAAEVQRLEESSRELESRALQMSAELREARGRIEDLRRAIVAGEAQLDEEIRALENARHEVRTADETVGELRATAEEREASVKVARASLDVVRREVADLDVARATAEADLTHLAATAAETVQATLDEIAVEIEEAERHGSLTPDARVICADEGEESDEEGVGREPVAATAAEGAPDTAEDHAQRALTAEEAILRLREKIDRLGPVNMMAIEQFDELDGRHAFLSTQRKDLVDSIAQTVEAIRRIDETTRQRFTEAFAAINQNFQGMFTTLFGGGRAGLSLLDENDPLESGIEIIAQPPGKRLQSIQLLSGGEKALTAIALMFGLFKYKPSPFCLLDEIDAPLDDANIGRFIEMLRSMQQHTQFILITHNRKTMEIADRLYGVTMEEPGVSKLISVQLN